MKGQVTLKTFSLVRDICGFEERTLEIDRERTAGDLVEELMEECPDLRELEGSLLIAVNQEYADRERPLTAGDTLAVFPPVSGG
jgi:molybdopterin converting factor subunit 1